MLTTKTVKQGILILTSAFGVGFGLAAFAPSKAKAYDANECRQDCVETANDKLRGVNCGENPGYCDQVGWDEIACSEECDRIFGGNDDDFADTFGDRDFIPDDTNDRSPPDNSGT